MYIIEKAKQFIRDKEWRKYFFIRLSDRIFHYSDRKYLEHLFYAKNGYSPNFDDPKTICEKLNWLKLYNRRPEYTAMVDKYEVKKYVAEKVGKQYIVPLLGVYNSFNEIDFDSLPEQFILKCTHNSGSFVVCKDKRTFDKENARKILSNGLNQNYFNAGREWVYKDVKPRIIAEEFIPALGARDSLEYKLTVCNGIVKMITICTGIAHSSFENRNNDNYDRDWNFLPFYVNYKNTGKVIDKPAFMDEMIDVAEKLGAGIPYVRVDFYYVDGKVLFGEMTFYTWSGFMHFTPPEYDQIMGEWIQLPQKFNELE